MAVQGTEGTQDTPQERHASPDPWPKACHQHRTQTQSPSSLPHLKPCRDSQVPESCRSPSLTVHLTLHLSPTLLGWLSEVEATAKTMTCPSTAVKAQRLTLPTLHTTDQGESRRRAQSQPGPRGLCATQLWLHNSSRTRHLLLGPLSGKSSLWFHHKLPPGFKSIRACWQIQKRLSEFLD